MNRCPFVMIFCGLIAKQFPICVTMIRSKLIFFPSHFLWNCASNASPSHNAEHLLSSSDGSTASEEVNYSCRLRNVLNKPPLQLPPFRFPPLNFIYQISIKYLLVGDLTLILLGVAPHDSKFSWVTSIHHLPVMTIATMQTIQTMLVTSACILGEMLFGLADWSVFWFWSIHSPSLCH